MDRQDLDNKIEEFCGYMTKARLSRRDFFKSLAVLSGSLLLLGQTENAYAHPPSDIAMTYDNIAKVLKVVITHPVSNPQAHFIKEVDIELNGKKIIEHKISAQDNHSTQTVSYLIPDAKAQDTVSIEAYCNISGSLKKEIKISY